MNIKITWSQLHKHYTDIYSRHIIKVKRNTSKKSEK